MDNIILLKRHLKDFVYLDTTEDTYGADGLLIPKEEKEIKFKAAPFPMDSKTISLFPQGVITFDDIVLYTKTELNTHKQVKRVSDGQLYSIFDKIAFLEVADLKVYLLKRVEKNG